MKRYIKSNDDAVIAYHTSSKPVSSLSVNKLRDKGNLGVHFTQSFEDACTISSQLLRSDTAYIYECKLTSVRSTYLEDVSDWTGMDVLFEFFRQQDMLQSADYMDAIRQFREMHSEDHKIEFIRQFFKNEGYNCIEYTNTAERNLKYNCLCVLNDLCIASVALVDTLKVE